MYLSTAVGERRLIYLARRFAITAITRRKSSIMTIFHHHHYASMFRSNFARSVQLLAVITCVFPAGCDRSSNDDDSDEQELVASTTGTNPGTDQGIGQSASSQTSPSGDTSSTNTGSESTSEAPPAQVNPENLDIRLAQICRLVCEDEFRGCDRAFIQAADVGTCKAQCDPQLAKAIDESEKNTLECKESMLSMIECAANRRCEDFVSIYEGAIGKNLLFPGLCDAERYVTQRVCHDWAKNSEDGVEVHGEAWSSTYGLAQSLEDDRMEIIISKDPLGCGTNPDDLDRHISFVVPKETGVSWATRVRFTSQDDGSKSIIGDRIEISSIQNGFIKGRAEIWAYGDNDLFANFQVLDCLTWGDEN